MNIIHLHEDDNKTAAWLVYLAAFIRDNDYHDINRAIQMAEHLFEDQWEEDNSYEEAYNQGYADGVADAEAVAHSLHRVAL